MKPVKQVLTAAQKQRLADQQINEAYRLGVWATRLQRKAREHKVYHVPDLLGKAQSIVWRDNLSVGCSNLFGANWTTPGTLQGLIKSGDLKPAWFDQIKGEWIGNKDTCLMVGTVPYCYARSTYDAESLVIANYEWMIAEYKDLITVGVLYQDDSRIVADLDAIAPDVDRLLALCQTLHGLSDYPCLDEDGMYVIERGNEAATLKSEASSFDDKLNMASFVRFPLIRSVTGETVAQIREREAPKVWHTNPTVDQEDANTAWERYLIGHMDDLIRRYDIEFGDDGTYIDVDKLVSLSPLKELGHSVLNSLYDTTYTLEDQMTLGFLGNHTDCRYQVALDVVHTLKQSLREIES